MKVPNDQTIALQFVERKISGYSPWSFYRGLAPQYCILLVCFCIFTIFSLTLEGGSALVVFAVGTAIGVLLRDVNWMRSSRATWRFTKKALDWDKVQRMADGKSL